MNTERFEALIDAILAIIITIIVMEIPLPASPTPESLFELYPEFISYALSFIVCFNFWNYHHNLFTVVNKLNSVVTWISAIGIMIIGLLPHASVMISTNFYSFTAHFMFGLIFFLTNINFYIVDMLLIKIDRANIALRVELKNRKQITIITTLLQLISMILGYLISPPIILVGCLLSTVVTFKLDYIKQLIE
jgi:uncharacterized membrane protein